MVRAATGEKHNWRMNEISLLVKATIFVEEVYSFLKVILFKNYYKNKFLHSYFHLGGYDNISNILNLLLMNTPFFIAGLWKFKPFIRKINITI